MQINLDFGWVGLLLVIAAAYVIYKKTGSVEKVLGFLVKYLFLPGIFAIIGAVLGYIIYTEIGMFVGALIGIVIGYVFIIRDYQQKIK